MQLDNGLILQSVQEKCYFMMTLKQVVSSYVSKVLGDVITLLLEAHFNQAIMLEIILMAQDFIRSNLTLPQIYYVFLHKFLKLDYFKKILTDIFDFYCNIS